MQRTFLHIRRYLMGVVHLVFGILIPVFGILGYVLIRAGRNQDRFCTIHTRGFVTDIVSVRSEDGVTYAPVVEFADDSGKMIRARSSMSTGRSAVEKVCPIGREVEVRYDPLDTSSFLIIGYDKDILGLVGRIFLGVTAVLALGYTIVMIAVR